mmetsp:Transcript_25206/g.38993  ORF Transcript_25206/g.38993 Transcript_25206/m.38993 type:complete len:543 (+) Transcript_25206:77-1705(+)
MLFVRIAIVISLAVNLTHAFSVPREGPSRSRRTTTTQRYFTLLMMNKRDKYNPIGQLMSGLIDAATSSVSNNMEVNRELDDRLNAIHAVPQWADIRAELEKQQTPEERKFRDNLELGIGTGSPLHKLRLFDASNKESDVRVTFFRDSASWCPYCQKVWLTLEEKRIPYRIEKVNMRCYGDKPASFTRLQPSGNIPVAIVDGQVYGQSNDILYVLEESFNQDGYKSLRPKDADRMRAQGLLRLERQIFSAWMYWLTGSRDPERYRQEFIEVLNVVENELASSKGGDFFLGKDVTTVDFMFAPFLERMAASLLFFKGFQMRVPPGSDTPFPAVNRWFDAMEKLDSYRLTKSDYYTHCWDLPPQLGGCTYEDNGAPFESAINGDRSLDGTQGSWELPLQPHNGGVEPDWGWCNEDGMARREAVERLSANFENVVKFAARGAGKKGMPPFSAALADPNAVPSVAMECSVDIMLRAVSTAMLTGCPSSEAGISEAVDTIISAGDQHKEGVVSSLAYLRERVGVPRDMRLPAARQFRAHLNWAIEKLL